jgi:two-component system nitrate/nitrite response regulator NarL
LTVRESQVAYPVAEGASNREIARRLDVQEKTVEMHLFRVFVKLGVANRVGVARESTRSPRPE